jgi:flagellar biosynthetic protein FliP
MSSRRKGRLGNQSTPLAALALVVILCPWITLITPAASAQGIPGPKDTPVGATTRAGRTDSSARADVTPAILANRPDELGPSASKSAPNPRVPPFDQLDATRTLQSVVLFALISLAPVAVLMVTAFVRINIVLLLLRQALGNPQVPGNQVLTALALLLTAIVMRPQGEEVYNKAIQPYASGRVSASEAWKAGTQPLKAFMVDQILLMRHQDYLEALNEYVLPPSRGGVMPAQARAEEFPLRVVAPAFLLSELTTALMMGFYLYLPFLVIDLVVSSVLAAMGLFMLPPGLVATPVKLIVFVLADGWLLVATMLLSSFTGMTSAP